MEPCEYSRQQPTLIMYRTRTKTGIMPKWNIQKFGRMKKKVSRLSRVTTEPGISVLIAIRQMSSLCLQRGWLHYRTSMHSTITERKLSYIRHYVTQSLACLICSIIRNITDNWLTCWHFVTQWHMYSSQYVINLSHWLSLQSRIIQTFRLI